MNKKISNVPYLVFITVCSTSSLSATVSFYLVWWSAGIPQAAYSIQDVHDIHYWTSLPNMGDVVYTRYKIHVWKSNEKTFHQVYCTQLFLLCFSMWVSSVQDRVQARFFYYSSIFEIKDCPPIVHPPFYSNRTQIPSWPFIDNWARALIPLISIQIALIWDTFNIWSW